jgi:hypothetical protein
VVIPNTSPIMQIASVVADTLVFSGYADIGEERVPELADVLAAFLRQTDTTVDDGLAATYFQEADAYDRWVLAGSPPM